jgi:AcrR family transcriptional regulator
MTTDHRTMPRRRGAALYAAIFQATLDELASSGYARLTMERVAERARVGKASLYRRWPSRMELVADAVYHTIPDPASPPHTGSLRGDLLALLRATAEGLAGPTGEALRGLLGEALPDAARLAELRQRSPGVGRTAMREVVRRAVQRGEVDPGRVTPRRLDTGHALLRQHFLFQGGPVPDAVIVEIVDEVVLPLLTMGSAQEA